MWKAKVGVRSVWAAFDRGGQVVEPRPRRACSRVPTAPKSSVTGGRTIHSSSVWRLTRTSHRPDVAVIDLQMPVVDGIDVIRELGRQLPTCAGVILTGHGRPHVLRRALTSGARGFLAKGAPATALADVVRRVHAGQRYVDPVLAADALTEPPLPLTPRETEVLTVAGEDKPIREVARRLVLSQGTVRNYLAAITQKLQAESRAEAYRIAQHNGWI